MLGSAIDTNPAVPGIVADPVLAIYSWRGSRPQEFDEPAVIYSSNGNKTVWLRYAEWLLTCRESDFRRRPCRLSLQRCVAWRDSRLKHLLTPCSPPPAPRTHQSLSLPCIVLVTALALHATDPQRELSAGAECLHEDGGRGHKGSLQSGSRTGRPIA